MRCESRNKNFSIGFVGAYSCWFPVQRDEGVKGRDRMKEERRRGMSGDEWR